MAAFAALAIIALQVASKIARDTLFLANAGVETLSYAMCTAAVVSVVLAFMTANWARARSPLELLVVGLATNAVLFLTEGAVLARAPVATSWLLFIHVSAFGPVIASAFWLHLADAIRGPDAPRTFASVSSGATLGGVCGGILAERVTSVFSFERLLLMLAAGAVTLAVGAFVAHRRSAPDDVEPSDPEVSTSSAVALVAERPYLRKLALLLALTAIATSIGDFVMKTSVAGVIQDATSLVAFFSLFHTLTGVLSFALQTTATRSLIERIGVRGTLALLPLSFGLLAGAGALLGRVLVAVLLRGTDAVLTNSVFRSSYELLYTGIPRDVVRSTKPVIDVVFFRLGDVVGSAFVALTMLAAPTLGITWLLAAAVLVSAVAAFLARSVGASYEHAAATEKAFLTARAQPA